MLFTFEKLLREPLRVSPPGQPLGERVGRGVVEDDGLVVAEEEGAGSVDEEGRVAVLADVLAASVGVISGMPDAFGEVEAAGVGAVCAEDSVCGETAPVGLVDPRLAGEGFVAAKFGDVREGRVLVVQVGLHGWSPRVGCSVTARMRAGVSLASAGARVPPRGAVDQATPTGETSSRCGTIPGRAARVAVLWRAVHSLSVVVSAAAHPPPPAGTGLPGGVDLRVMRLEQHRQAVHECVHTVR